ncbi:heavy-metal-associated domain-containing protein [Peribacillus sp. SCS-37]|uniref:heavy-metal-associated domain-containing protein n=1 Tax=Paraperibacillus esterisolvens TaxID=3115296 RepID=UPI003905A91B
MEETGVIKIKGSLTSEDREEIVHALNDVWGVLRADVNLESGEARIGYDKNAASFLDFQQAVRECGYDILTQDENLPFKE